MIMKYYIGKINEVNGGMEYDTKYLFATNGNPDKYSRKVARDWRGCEASDWDKNDGGWWSDCTLVCDDGSREIPEEDFKVLSKYLAVL
jgi:hypothetical protein